jgi:hypothetical protein
MKTLIALAFAAATLTAANAQTWTQNRIGGTTFLNGTTPNGQPVTGTSNWLGQTRFDNYQTPQGSVQCTTNYIGQTAFTHCN